MVLVSTEASAAAIVYLVFYVIYSAAATKAVWTTGWKNCFTLLLTYGLVRLASQISGIVYFNLGSDARKALTAYLVLGDEGYIILVVCGLCYLIHSQRKVNGNSWLKPRKHEKESIRTTGGFIKRLSTRIPIRNISFVVLFVANIFLIYGGCTSQKVNSKRSSLARKTGQTLILTQLALVIGLSCYIYFKEHVKTYLVKAVMISSPFLVVRGIFGLLSLYVDSMDYYRTTGLHSNFIVQEYLMGITMEFVVASLLLTGYFLDKRYTKVIVAQTENYGETDIDSSESSMIKE